MRILVAIVGAFIAISSCRSSDAKWGDFEFVLEEVENWRGAEVSSCVSRDEEQFYLFGRESEYYLVTNNGASFDIARFDLSGSHISIEANGGLGRYAELENTFASMRQLPRRSISRESFRNYLRTVPAKHCGF